MSAFWDDLAEDLRDPEFREAFEAELVRLEPCASFRIPLDGDLMTCRDCGWWINEHEARMWLPTETAVPSDTFDALLEDHDDVRS